MPLTDPYNKNKLPFLSRQAVKAPSKGELQLQSKKSDCNLFPRLYLACQATDDDVDQFHGHEYNQARIQLLAKGEVVKIMENNVSDHMPRKRVPQPARMSFCGYIIDSECTSWEPICGTVCVNLPVGPELRDPNTF